MSASGWLARARFRREQCAAHVPARARQWVFFLAFGLTVVTWFPMLLAALDLSAASWQSAVYELCAPFCHQDVARSFHVGSTPFPLCARCTGMWLGLTVGVCVAMVWVKPYRWAVGLSVAALALVGSVADVAREVRYDDPQPWIRAILGMLVYAGLAWALAFDLLTVLVAVAATLKRRLNAALFGR